MSVGIDIVEISRIELNDKFINFVLSKEEISLLEKRINKEEFLAGRFAAKEAFLKANGKGIGGIPLKEIKVLNEETGKPYIICNEIKYEDVSISHEKHYAVAIVIL
jgi:holo-[acyl-carrier protein] synthase